MILFSKLRYMQYSERGIHAGQRYTVQISVIKIVLVRSDSMFISLKHRVASATEFAPAMADFPEFQEALERRKTQPSVLAPPQANPATNHGSRVPTKVSCANASRNQPGPSNAPQMYSTATESTITKSQSSVPTADVKSSEVTAAQTYEQLISMLISQMAQLKPLLFVQEKNAKKLVVTMIRLIRELLTDLETLI